MARCIGCKCCVVACNEQNGNPANINWRRVGEIEGGWYPETRRFYLSMGCNHCLGPTCLQGCPVEAYTKDPATGIVLHSAEACIGCQYCTWNCSYGVPQYNPERGVVGKCDLCAGRLAEQREPACVAACPEGAIQVEIVNLAAWKQEYAAQANAPGLPAADDSFSTTRITLPKNLPPDASRVDLFRLKPELPHWPLVIMTVLTQLSVGTFAVIWLLQVLGKNSRLGVAAVSSLLLAAVALSASTLHLGRPIRAYRALRMWKRSWLSREVLLFSAFSAVACLYSAALWTSLPGSSAVGFATAMLGLGGITASACIYLVRARPAWNSAYTLAEFFLTGALLGPLFASCIGAGDPDLLLLAAASAATGSVLLQAMKLFWLASSEIFELRATTKLISGVLRTRFLMRAALLLAGGVVLPLLASANWHVWAALFLAAAGEVLGRYLFFVSVVPKNMGTSYLGGGRTAA
jgi:formate dehydrogenase iron-sulfur subunit